MDDRETNRFPLAAYDGRKIPGPAWFVSSIARIPEATRVEVDGAQLEMYTWGRQGAPGLLFLHGNKAHAGWWNFIAPFFEDNYRTSTFSWSGMGASAWRNKYSVDIHAAEVIAVAKAAGLFSVEVAKPVIVAHSYGAQPAIAAIRRWPGCFSGCVIVDSRLAALATRTKKNRVNTYSSLVDALARFRFAPHQECRNPFIADFLARKSLKKSREPDGWTWRFDPRQAMQPSFPEETIGLRSLDCSLAFVYGEHSRLTSPAILRSHRRACSADTLFTSIPEAEHHVMVDQPIALVAALRSILGFWNHGLVTGSRRTRKTSRGSLSEIGPRARAS
jgi:pimeloyl-ACP methyl ester carboxylesterase